MARTLLLTIHIASVACWLGANAVQLAVGGRFEAAGTSAHLAWLRTTGWMAQRYYNVAGVAVGVSGVGLVLHGDWSWGSGFIWVGIVAVAVGAALGIGEFIPTNRRTIEAVEAGDSARVAMLGRRTIGFAVVDTAVVLVTVVAMVHTWAS